MRRRTRIALLLLGLLASAYVLGEYGARFGSDTLAFNPWWLGIGLALALASVPPVSRSFSLTRYAVVGTTVLALLWPLYLWRRSVTTTSPPKSVTYSRLGELALGEAVRTEVESLQIAERRILNRIVGRRRDVRMQMSGALLVPETGQHRFELACDDRCVLRIDEELVGDFVHLEAGFHRFELLYEQDAGPAHLRIAWDRPAAFELLGLDHFVAEKSAGLSPSAVAHRALVVSLSATAEIAWWALGLGLLLTGAERARGALDQLAGVDGGGAVEPRHRHLVYASFVAALAVPVFDLIVFGLPDRTADPSLTVASAVRTTFLMASAGFFTAAVHAFASGRESETPVAGRGAAMRFLRWPLLLLAAFFPMLSFYDVELFSRLGAEDGPVENASALLLLSSSVMVFVAARRVLGTRPRRGGEGALLIALASVLFVIGMEEISWGQRILGFGTPEPFLENSQPEMNLHNIATDLFEHAYYVLAAVLLIVLPFVQERTRLFDRLPPLASFVPSLSIAFMTAPLAAYNYDLWGSAPIQLVFHLTVLILAYYAWIHVGDRAYLLTLVLTVIGIQLALLTRQNVVRYWDWTEYKELLIPLGFLLYAFELCSRFGAQRLSETSP